MFSRLPPPPPTSSRRSVLWMRFTSTQCLAIRLIVIGILGDGGRASTGQRPRTDGSSPCRQTCGRGEKRILLTRRTWRRAFYHRQGAGLSIHVRRLIVQPSII